MLAQYSNFCQQSAHRMPDVLKATTFKVQKNIKLGFVSFFERVQKVYNEQLFSP